MVKIKKLLIVFLSIILFGSASIHTFAFDNESRVEVESALCKYKDVSSEAYYSAAVLYLSELGIVKGISDGVFKPNRSCSRGEMVTFLYRCAKCPDTSDVINPFEDISESDYFYSAVLWAYSNGITSGMTESKFGPGESCTRAQAVTFLYRAKSIFPISGGDETSYMMYDSDRMTSAPFADVDRDAYYFDSVLWAYSNGITKGVSDTSFAPGNALSRGQIVTFLYRCLNVKPANEKVVIDVPYLSQLPDFPTGCESLSAVMALRYLGYKITPDEFIDKYLPLGDVPYYYAPEKITGSDPYVEFPGNPRDEFGWGCFSPVINKAIKKYVGNASYVHTLTGFKLDHLCRQFIDNGIPVIVWASVRMAPPNKTITWESYSGREVTWLSPEHCLVLTGYDDEYYYFNDPLVGKDVQYLKYYCRIAYEAFGSQAVAVW